MINHIKHPNFGILGEHVKILTMIIILLISTTMACKGKKIDTKKVEKKAEKVTKKIVEQVEKPTSKPSEEGLGQWITMDSYGVRFRVPNDWLVKKTEASASANSPDGNITVLLVGSESENMIQSAFESLKKEVTFEELKTKSSGATIINGMPGYSAVGTAVEVKGDDKNEIQFIMNAVKVDGKAAALLVFAEATMYEAKKEEIDGLVKTLKKR